MFYKLGFKRLVLAAIALLWYSFPLLSNIDSLSALLETPVSDDRRSEIHRELSEIYASRQKYQLAGSHLRKSIELLPLQSDTTRYVSGLITLSGYYLQSHLLESAYETARLASQVSAEYKMEFIQGQALLNEGMILKEMNDNSRALESLYKALELFKLEKDSLLMSYALNGIGMVRKKQDQLNEARNYFKQSLYLKEKFGTAADIITTKGNIANLLKEEKKYDSASIVYQQILYLTQKEKLHFFETVTLLNIADLYNETGDLQLAKTYYETVTNKASRHHFWALAGDAYEELIKHYARARDYVRAFETQEKLIALRDSLQKADRENKVAELQHLYNEQLNKSRHRLIEDENTQRIRLLYLIIIVLLLTTIAFIHFRSIKLRKARNAYRASENKFRMLAENASEVVWATDLDLNLTYISPSTEKLFGYPRHERMKLPLSKVVSSGSFKQIQDNLGKKLDEFKNTGKIGEPVVMEIKGNHRQGQTIWIEVSANLSLDENGELKGIQGVSRDITARKNTEIKMLDLIENLRNQDQALKIQNQKLQEARYEIERTAKQYYDLFENGPVGYLILDEEACIKELNSAAAELIGGTRELVQGKKLLDFIKKDQRKGFLLQHGHCLNGEKHFGDEYKLQNAYVRMVFSPDAFHSEKLCRVAVIDISEAKETRDKLTEAFGQLNSVFDTIPGGISVIDTDYNVINLNSKLLDINNVKHKREVIGKKCYEVYRCGDKPCESCSLIQVIKQRKTIVRQTSAEDELLTGAPYRIYSSPMFDENDQIVGMVEAVMDISDLHKAEEALRLSEKKFEKLFQQIPDAIFISRFGEGRSGEILDVNPAAEKHTGYSRNELIGMNLIEDLVDHEVDDRLTVLREKKLSENQKIELVEKKRRKDGSVIWTEVVIQKISDNRSLSVSRDITDRKIAEENLRISEAKNRLLLNVLPDLLFIFDKEGRFIDYHTDDISKLIMRPEKFLNLPVAEVLPPYLAEITMEKIKQVLETGKMQVYEYKIDTPKGTTYHESRMVKSGDDQVLTVVRDITETREAEMEVRQQEEKYRTIFINSPVGIFNFNQDGVILDCNENFVKIIGSDRSKLIGFNMLKKVRDQKLIHALRDAIVSGSGYYEDYYRSVTADKITPVKLFLKTIRDENKGFVDGIGIVEDITEQKKYEEQLLAAKKKAEESDRLKSSFMATMSHELRTPLNTIIGFSDLIEPGLTDDQIVESAHIIAKSGKQLLQVIEDIFDISSIDSGEVKINIEGFYPEQVMEEAAMATDHLLESHKKTHVAVKLNLPEHLYEKKLFTDVHKLQKILSHLIKNAVKFTRDGFIELGMKTVKPDNGGDLLLIYVKDTGIGIPKDKHELIFKVFRQVDETSTREFEGTGLGLTIARKLAELLKGRIWLESQPGKGSTFYVEVPCFPDPHDAFEIQAGDSFTGNDCHAGTTVVVAEDDDNNFQLFELLLRRKRINVVRAATGKQAVEIAINQPEVQLVLMDINLPEMDGFTATREIRKVRPKLPVIAITAFAGTGEEEGAFQAGCDDYLTKPINNRLFFDSVLRHLSV